MKYLHLFILISVLLLIGCKPTVPSKYIQPDDMEDILYDYHLAQSMARTGKDGLERDYNKTLLFNAVLKKHDVTEADFDSSLVYYYSHVDRLSKIYKGVQARMDNEAKSIGASVGEMGKYSQYKTVGDTANIWKQNTNAILIPYPPYNRLDFELTADTTYRKGDSFLLNFMSDFMYQTGTKDAVVCMSVQYSNDSISSYTTHVSVSGLAQLRIPSNLYHSIKRLRGFVYLDKGSEQSNTLKLMVISRIQLIRFHPDKSQQKGVSQQSTDYHQLPDQPIHNEGPRVNGTEKLPAAPVKTKQPIKFQYQK